ncbi:hypothetical protein AKS96_26 [Escherichia phage vB_EcoS_AKS96]|uniref:Uncharacterized protein n=2 Tax=Rogunavirus TaxID=1920866 RepID=A0A067YXI8_9CAUD|nr:hypothetical protein LD31_gp26 [Escherichia phage vB_EcoS_AKS96]YP_009056544.1 hypothetical protein LD32_gp28 [Escherichia phage vB_EcoS_AHP42]AHI60574.1 hypothetical protein AHP42_28 [Escherichia phage vB_EcoS_AHP42]AHI60729.1 hypothetical protein AKS96_26 [Escherichia phage vB_EcoS_AKS96]
MHIDIDRVQKWWIHWLQELHSVSMRRTESQDVFRCVLRRYTDSTNNQN